MGRPRGRRTETNSHKHKQAGAGGARTQRSGGWRAAEVGEWRAAEVGRAGRAYALLRVKDEKDRVELSASLCAKRYPRAANRTRRRPLA